MESYIYRLGSTVPVVTLGKEQRYFSPAGKDWVIRFNEKVLVPILDFSLSKAENSQPKGEIIFLYSDGEEGAFGEFVNKEGWLFIEATGEFGERTTLLKDKIRFTNYRLNLSTKDRITTFQYEFSFPFDLENERIKSEQLV